jgi:TolB-like protein
VNQARAKTREPPPVFESPTRTPPTASSASAVPAPGATDMVDQPRPLRSRHRSLPFVIGAIVTLVVIIATVLLHRMADSSTASVTARPSILVLPFETVGGAHQDATLADGLTEKLTAALTTLGHARVIGGASALAFKNSDVSSRRIADSLGISTVLEGSVQKVDSELRVQVRLIHARDGSVRWSETYDRTLRNTGVVQSDIAATIAHALDLQLGGSTLAGIKRGSTSSIAAYELYARGNDPVLLRSDSGARVGLEYFRQAIALDKNYAAAYAGLARMQLRIASGDDTVMSRRKRLLLAEGAALNAVRLDDSLGEAHATLSLVRKDNYDLTSAEAELARAIALEPNNARFREWLVQLEIAADRPAEALVEARRALQLDPLSPSANAELAHALLANDRCDEALAQLDKLKSLRPPLLRAGGFAAQCYASKHKWREAIAEMPSPAIAGPRAEAQLGYLFARDGRVDEARRIQSSLLDRARRINGGAFEVATVYAGLGDDDHAFLWLAKSVDDRSFEFENQMMLNGLRHDARFDRLRQRFRPRAP